MHTNAYCVYAKWLSLSQSLGSRKVVRRLRLNVPMYQRQAQLWIRLEWFEWTMNVSECRSLTPFEFTVLVGFITAQFPRQPIETTNYFSSAKNWCNGGEAEHLLVWVSMNVSKHRPHKIIPFEFTIEADSVQFSRNKLGKSKIYTFSMTSWHASINLWEIAGRTQNGQWPALDLHFDLSQTEALKTPEKRRFVYGRVEIENAKRNRVSVHPTNTIYPTYNALMVDIWNYRWRYAFYFREVHSLFLLNPSLNRCREIVKLESNKFRLLNLHKNLAIIFWKNIVLAIQDRSPIENRL